MRTLLHQNSFRGIIYFILYRGICIIMTELLKVLNYFCESSG